MKNGSAAIDQWTATQTIPHQIASLSTITDDNRIFIMGGANSDDYSDVFISSMNLDGSIQEWTSNVSLPNGRYWSSSVVQNQFVYLLGGASFNGSTEFQNSVLFAQINSGGITSWSSLTPLPQPLSLGGVFIYNNRLYFAGGLGSSISDIIYSAPINSDGTIGSWSNSGALPEPMYGMGIYEHGGKLFLLGGTANGVGTSEVYTADISSSDGSVSNWQQLPDAPAYIAGQQSVLVGDTFVFISGNHAYYTKINQSNTLDAWQTSQNTIPQSIAAGKLV
ncbi:MAG: hypothetical protein KA477_01355, partial [Candidatus Levybacteria bacterium]|nr:hypothetical protein [Candidatus Levybacteria bacterium]